MQLEDILEILEGLEAASAPTWVDGGWCVDALVGRQLRTHDDLDIAVHQEDEEALRSWLVNQGFHERNGPDDTAWNFVACDGRGRSVNVHVFAFGANGSNTYGVEYPARVPYGLVEARRRLDSVHRSRVDVPLQDGVRTKNQGPRRRPGAGGKVRLRNAVDPPRKRPVADRLPAAISGAAIFVESASGRVFRASVCLIGERCHPAACSSEDLIGVSAVERSQSEEVLRDGQAQDAAHRDHGAELCVVSTE